MTQTHNKEDIVILPLKPQLEENISSLQELFTDCGDFIGRKFTIGKENRKDVFIAYIDNMVERELLEESVIRNLLYRMDQLPAKGSYDYIKERGLQTADIIEVTTMDEITNAILVGDVPLIIDGFEKAIIISLKSYPGRGVPSVESEVTVKGAKDAFTESIALNKVLIRRRIKDTRLKIENLEVGSRSRTFVSLAYVDGIVQKDVLKEVKERIDRFVIDGIFDVGMLEQLTENAWYSPFPQYQSTERPDKTASSLLEGRVAILVDNSPMVLLLPATLSTFFQAADDYYNRWGITSFIRTLRYIGAMLALSLPGLYIAIANYQPEMIPTPLMLSLAASRQGVPFSNLLEMIILLLAFELLTEAGIRLPSPMGNTIGVVGGLIIGDAAISANLVSPMVVIVVAFTAITSFTIPNEGFTSALRISRYLILILSALLGLYGYILGMMLIYIHLAGLKSFGIPYLSPFVASDYVKENPAGDSIVKFPIFRLRRRPLYSKEDEEIRLVTKKNEKKSKQAGE